MGSASLAIAAALVGLCAAGFHAWVFAAHRSARRHLWIAVTALGMAAVSWAGATLVEAASWPAVLGGLRLQLVGSVLTLIGFLHFSARHLRLEIRPLLRAFDAAGGAVVALVVFAPHLLFQARSEQLALPAPVAALHGFSGFGQAAIALLVAGSLGIVGLYVRSWRSGDPAARPLLPVLAVWLAAGLNDAAVGVGLYRAPYLLAGGYLLLVLGLSAMLTRRLAHAGDYVERMAARLREMAEARAEQLRERDLQLARGEQLAALGTLAAGVAHEINNPLAYVNSNLHQLEAIWGKEEDPDEVAEILADCQEGIERVRSIAASLVRMGRRGDARFEPTDVPAVVRSVLPMLRQEARSRARLVDAIEETPPVHGNAQLLGQVVLNLTLNALQAIAAGAPASHRVEVSTAFRGGWVQLSVRDSGPGIPRELVPRIFEPFFTTKQKGEGTGLGLTVTRQIVVRHRGEIRLTSGDGGTTVTVCLPPAEAEPSARS